MIPDNDRHRTLRKDAAALATAVNSLSEQIGDVSRGLSSLKKYGHRNRMMIVTTIVSLVIELSLMAALAIITSNVIYNNHRINNSVSSIHCLTRAIAEVLPRRSAFYDTSIVVLNLKSAALAKDVSAQVSNGSAAERHVAQVTYLRDIAAINQIKIPPLPVFSPHC